MNKITNLVLAIVFIGAVGVLSNYVLADNCGGKCHNEFTLYIPFVAVQNVKAGYAWTHNDLFGDVLGMRDGHIWIMTDPQRGYIPHFSCNVSNYNDFDNDAVNQFASLRSYVDEVGDAPFILVFLNEPEMAGQCSRTPENAAYMYKKVLEIAPNAIVTTPQVSHGDYHKGWLWLNEWYRWIDKLALPHPEIGAIHTYMNEPAHLIIDSFMSEFDVDRIWVTEWAATSPAVLLEMLDTFETDPRIEKHFYFDPTGEYWGGVRLIESDGELTPLGDAWVNYFNEK